MPNGGPAKVHLGNGETLTFSGAGQLTQDEDANGNIITYAYGNGVTVTDTVGRTITIAGQAGGVPSSITYTDTNGSAQTITFSSQNYTIHTHFPTNLYGEENQDFTWSLLTSIVMPNGDTWGMRYDPDSGGYTYGELTKITYPTGGYSTYNYTFAGTAAGDPSGATSERQVVGKGVCRSYTGTCATLDTTTITPTPAGSVNTASTVLNAVGDQTIYAFSGALETSRKIYSGTSTLLRTVTTVPTCEGPTSITTTLDNGLVSKVVPPAPHGPYTVYGYRTVTNPSTSPYTTTAQEYDYGTGSPGTLLRQTATTWLHINSVNSQDYSALPIYIIDRTLSNVVQNGSGGTVAQTQFEYDNYGTIQASGATQHDSAFGTSYTKRGNVDKTSRWLNTNGTWLNTTSAYDDAGNVVSITDPKSNQTLFSYTDNFTDGTNHSSAAYVTQTTLPTTNGISHVSRKQYYYNSGLTAASCGENFPSATGCTNTAVFPQPDYATTTYDMLGRPQISEVGDTGTTTTCYSDLPGSACSTGSQISVQTTETIASGINKVSVTLLDGLGRATQTQLTSDPEGIDYVDITFDGIGRKSTVSNPHRTSSLPTDGTTTYYYDGLNRAYSVLEADGSTVSTSYVGNTVTVTDETLKQRESVTDGLGRLTQVLEDPGSSPHLNYETDYQYDTLGNLTRVDQKGTAPSDSSKWRTRTFTYDSLSQLVCAANPEIQSVVCPTSPSGPFPAGASLYTYDSDGNVSTKQTPAPNQLTASTTETVSYTYDALNRLTQKSFSAISPLLTPTIKYGFDGVAPTGCTPPSLTDNNPKGRRTSMCDASGSTAWNHEKVGRIGQETRIINGKQKSISYTYKLDGSFSKVTYPGTGKVITYTSSAAGRVLSAKNVPDGINYATGALYTPAGALNQMQNGASIKTTEIYNSRSQPCWIYATTGTALAATTLCTGTSSTGTIQDLKYNFGVGTNDNGNVIQIVNNRDSNRTQNFLYDPLNRISQAYTSGPSWGETFGPSATNPGVQPTSPGIDAWGNLTNRSAVNNKTNYEGLATAPASAQNQLNGYCHDAAGNLGLNATCPTGTYNPTYFYDAENHMISATAGYSYIYDGDGNRVEKCTAGSTAGTCAASPTGTLYWADITSSIISESDLTGTMQEEYMFFGKRIARRDVSSGNVHYYFSDSLGSTSLVTNASGTMSVCPSSPTGYTSIATGEEESDYYPYGGEIKLCDNSPQHYKFSGKERDTESGLDDFVARYYSSAMGRFMMPDWSAGEDPVPYAQLGSPQTLNLYGYVMNNPVSKVDPTGHVGRGDFFCAGYSSHCDSDLLDDFKENIWNAHMSGISVESVLNAVIDSDEYSPFAFKVVKAGAQNKKHKPKPKPLVKGQPSRTVPNKPGALVYERTVDYYTVTPDGTATHESHKVTLDEKFVGPPAKKALICSTTCQPGDDFVPNGEFEDGQSVVKGDPYTVEKRFSVDGQPAQILNDKNTPFDYEILHNSTETNPPFQSEYGNDPPK